MTNSKVIQENAHSLYTQGMCEEAFTVLKSLSASEFWHAIKENKKGHWLKEKDKTKLAFVWIQISKDYPIKFILDSVCCEDFLFEYFRTGYYHSPELAQHFPAEYSVKVILAIRTTQFYLYAENEDIINSLSLAPKLELHRTFWLKIRETEKTLWSLVLQGRKDLGNIRVEELLIGITIGFEKRRFSDNSTQMIQHLAEIYNVIIELLTFKLNSIDFKNLNLMDLSSEFCNHLGSNFSSGNQRLIENLISSCENWINLKKRVLDHYSFDLEYDLNYQNGAILLSTTAQHFYKSRLDGIRYVLNMWHYNMQAADIVDELVETGEMLIPKGKNKKYEELNKVLAQNKMSVRMILEDLQLTKVQNSSKKIDIESWLVSIMPHVFNRKVSYEDRMTELSNNSNGWQNAYIAYCFKYFGKSDFTFPFEYFERSEFIDFLHSPSPQISKESISDFLEFVSFKGCDQLDRFNMRYDVWSTPFVLSDGRFFCPTIFFANNNWFYSTAQAALNHQRYNNPNFKETQAMEDNLADAFGISTKWKIKRVTQNEANSINGDVDIVVEDGRNTLLIQLKRTYFRLNLKDMRNEEVNSDRKAIEQLSKAFEHMSSESPLEGIDTPTMKWIVSTSFERINSRNKGCLKINFFELLRGLRNLKFETIEDLENHLTSNTEMKMFLDAVQKIPQITADPIIQEMIGNFGIFDSSQLFHPIFITDSEWQISYNEKYNSAYDFYERGQHSEALQIWQDCSTVWDSDPDLWASMANAYADLKQYEKAETHFQKAIEINPDNPTILRDMSIAQIESGNYFAGLLTLISLNEKYPIMAPSRWELRDLWHEATEKGKLNQFEYILIYEKMKVMQFW